MTKIMFKAALAILAPLFLAGASSGLVIAQPSPSPVVRPAIDGIIDAFKSHPLVVIGDAHGLAQEEDFFAALVRDPRFAREVGNVVVEFGGAIHQDIIDRYVEGGHVPYVELRKVWTDTVGWIPVVRSVGYINFFAQVRMVNLGLPPEQRIHVWLGEPEIDWSKINSHAEWDRLDATRESYPVNVIVTNILAKGKTALVIAGTRHFAGPLKGCIFKKLQAASWPTDTMKGNLEQQYPGALFMVVPYTGAPQKSCSLEIERGMHEWQNPALASPVRGPWLEGELPRCHPINQRHMNSLQA
jgi:hypothetical protein